MKPEFFIETDKVLWIYGTTIFLKKPKNYKRLIKLKILVYPGAALTIANLLFGNKLATIYPYVSGNREYYRIVFDPGQPIEYDLLDLSDSRFDKNYFYSRANPEDFKKTKKKEILSLLNFAFITGRVLGTGAKRHGENLLLFLDNKGVRVYLDPITKNMKFDKPAYSKSKKGNYQIRLSIWRHARMPKEWMVTKPLPLGKAWYEKYSPFLNPYKKPPKKKRKIGRAMGWGAGAGILAATLNFLRKRI